MPFIRVMGIDVFEDEEYQRYRDGMTPILHSFGGAFGYDFKVSEVLISKTEEKINRVFTIEFPSREVMDTFFSSPEYLAVQQRHFVNSVGSKTVIAMHDVED